MKRHFFLLICVLIALSPMGWVFSASERREVRTEGYVARDLPAPAPSRAHTPNLNDFCTNIYTGTLSSRFLISSPRGVSNFHNYHLVNFDQRLISQSANSVEIEITSQIFLDTRAPYPVDSTALPADVQSYLSPSWGVQSNDPEIIAKAQELVSGATTQAESVDAVLTWVRASIAYDYSFSLPNDASAVFRNRSGVCAGFSNLATALLRAARIPARYQSGCVAKYGWVVGDAGGWHAWVETYYPDVGWVASDPQVTENYVDTSHVVLGFDQCGGSGTVISQISNVPSPFPLYALQTSYNSAIWPSLNAAQIPAWDRHPLRVTPASYSLMLAIPNPTRTISFQVQNVSCGAGGGWQIRNTNAWITPSVVTGTATGDATFTVNGTGMANGAYTGMLIGYGSADSWGWTFAVSRTIPLNLWLADRVYSSNLPYVGKGR